MADIGEEQGEHAGLGWIGGVVRKRFTSSPKFLAQSGKHWYITEGKMEDLQEKTSTNLKVTGYFQDQRRLLRTEFPVQFPVPSPAVTLVGGLFRRDDLTVISTSLVIFGVGTFAATTSMSRRRVADSRKAVFLAGAVAYYHDTRDWVAVPCCRPQSQDQPERCARHPARRSARPHNRTTSQAWRQAARLNHRRRGLSHDGTKLVRA